MEESNECNGCSVYEDRCYLYSFYKHADSVELAQSYIESCPCRLCIVKVMCYSSCYMFDEHAENIKRRSRIICLQR
jgi:hypothetical protein